MNYCPNNVFIKHLVKLGGIVRLITLTDIQNRNNMLMQNEYRSIVVVMVTAELKIKCWKCGREEYIVEIVDDNTIDFNLNKPCPNCWDSWMTKKELTIKRNPK